MATKGLERWLTTKIELHNRDSKLSVEKPLCIYYDLINGILPKLFKNFNVLKQFQTSRVFRYLACII